DQPAALPARGGGEVVPLPAAASAAEGGARIGRVRHRRAAPAAHVAPVAVPHVREPAVAALAAVAAAPAAGVVAVPAASGAADVPVPGLPEPGRGDRLALPRAPRVRLVQQRAPG